ncbi:hypothetical protein CR156_14870 [Stenotrophomonas lactitubi]|uniref:DUF7002 family protein n=1 Tax=Stenotrophomonas TaxID=40323 RepID=UPI000C2725C9|nr:MULTISPECIES: hypothetical protein [Stenotrophomonas]MBA0250510.1 hypothetical protein [Stenotrophomonas maltophilia]MBA0320022.1 hypothetical protein [Stenotrophomonas maltophilia]PJO54418.1 hypothetical protein CR156_14870 [Stenotrophomonas lactitubi]
MDINFLVNRYPQVFHMANAGSWPSIRDRGLLSATAALDILNVSGPERAGFEDRHRPEMASIHPGLSDDIVLRDQKPMPPKRIEMALPSDVSAADWYRLINGKVFFWARKERLLRLLNSYRDFEHDVLTLDTSSLLTSHASRVRLCHMNSGNTWPMPHPRDASIFKSIDEYPVRPSGLPQKEVVELVIEYGVPDIKNHVVAVTRMRGSDELGVVWSRD